MLIQPYIVIPNLIEQPTWGGKYIAKFKNLPYKKIQNLNIGQSYELFNNSKLSLKSTTLDNPSIEISSAQNLEKTQQITKSDNPFSIQSFIDSHPEEVLGKKYLNNIGKKIDTLIKFTQAKGNSYQIHVRKKTKHWLPKPESWYFFEAGLITLGAKQNIDWDNYKKVCQDINQQAKILSQQIQNNQISLPEAQEELTTFVKEKNPEKFVNVVTIKSNQAVDISRYGGIHHSWEENPKIIPNGNILYEVQQNVYDNISTIRSFDKGKIKPDGSIRSLQITDYFQYIDKSRKANQPLSHIVKVKTIVNSPKLLIKQIFSTTNYSMQEIAFRIKHQEKMTNSFHHLFVKQGLIQVVTNNCNLTISKGHSVFIPAGVKTYQLLSSKKSTVLKTYL